MLNEQLLTLKEESGLTPTLQRMVSLIKQILVNTHITKMEEEHHNNQVSKYRLLDSIDDLSLVRTFIEASNGVVIYGELEIEPFVEFSLPFQAQYWYLKYMLLKLGQVDLDSDEQKSLYDEQGLNVIWLSIRNQCNTIIECKDGGWFVSIFDQDDVINTLLKSYKLSPV